MRHWARESSSHALHSGGHAGSSRYIGQIAIPLVPILHKHASHLPMYKHPKKIITDHSAEEARTNPKNPFAASQAKAAGHH
jgi:hypothetical protein